MNQRDAIIAALKARGEVQVPDRTLTKYEKWTRRFLVKRNPDGTLVPARADDVMFYYVGRTGALRVGTTSSTSASFQGKLRNALILEGESLDK